MKNSHPLRIGMLLASVAALIVSIGLYAYLYHDTLVLADHVILAQNSVADERQRQDQSKSILALASSTDASRTRLSSFFIPADDAVAFIQALESTGASSGATVSIASIAESDPEAGKNIGTLNAHITMNGSWSTVMNAIELFEVLPYKIKISHLTLDTSIGAGDRVAAARTWQSSFDISASTLK